MTPETSVEIHETGLSKINNTFMPHIEKQLSGNGIRMSDYQKQCVLSAIQSINAVVAKSKNGWSQIDQSNMTDTLLSIAALQLNAAAVPREVYFQTRSIKQGDNWVTQIEMGIEGDGNDSMLSRFGRNVKTIHPFWEVREEDEFTYPGYHGLELTPPTWQPTGQGRVIRVVYPIELNDGSIDYRISEREKVVYNLLAHINNNLMNETFGFVKGTKQAYGKTVARTRFDATKEEKAKIDEKKAEIMNRLQAMVLDEILADEEAQKYISPAWKSPQSREAMFIRKMRNNAIKKVPKDFGSAYVALKYQEQDDEVVSTIRKDVTENTGSELYDFSADVLAESADIQEEPDTVDGEYVEVEPEPEPEPEDPPKTKKKNRGF
ncbi:hypothetical protein IGJ74_001782 [Enterococcus sp. AZ009]|uniref:hypothetical protein n=1 Tax=Enterococcus TaxID=1350 RepID=UPI001C448C00|nr:hypothetical protein [Enterococcus casseliflavus]